MPRDNRSHLPWMELARRATLSRVDSGNDHTAVFLVLMLRLHCKTTRLQPSRGICLGIGFSAPEGAPKRRCVYRKTLRYQHPKNNNEGLVVAKYSMDFQKCASESRRHIPLPGNHPRATSHQWQPFLAAAAMLILCSLK